MQSENTRRVKMLNLIVGWIYKPIARVIANGIMKIVKVIIKLFGWIK